MTATTERTAPRLKAKYRDEIKSALQEQFSYGNVMQVPRRRQGRREHGCRRRRRDSKLIEGAVRDLTAITGQKPQVTKARKSIAQFKLREGTADRLPHHAARRPDVGVPRPAGHGGAAPYPRLPRPVAASSSTGAATTPSV
jgi:hypothetical protein